MKNYAVVVHYVKVDRIVLCQAIDRDEAFEKVRTFVLKRGWHSASIRSVTVATSQDCNAAEHSL